MQPEQQNNANFRFVFWTFQVWSAEVMKGPVRQRDFLEKFSLSSTSWSLPVHVSRVTWSRVTCTSCQQSLCQLSRLNFKDITFLQILKTHQIFPITFELQDKEVIFNISICFLAHPKQKTNKPYSKMIQEDAGKLCRD